MAVDVHAARIPDRDRLLELLREHGLDAEPQDELEIVVASSNADGEVYHEVEALIVDIGAPFVPIQHEGAIYVRPPVG